MKPVADERQAGSMSSWLAGDAPSDEAAPQPPITPVQEAEPDLEPEATHADEELPEPEPTIDDLLRRISEDEFDIEEESLERIEALLGEALRRPADRSRPEPEGSAVDPVPTVDELLDSLGDATRAVDTGTSSLQRVTDQVQEHAAALNAAARAQEEAHQLLSLAKKERDSASAAAAKLIDEARQSAARLTEEAEAHAEVMREQTRREAAERRANIEAVAAEFREAAERDAERLRAEASASAMEDARKAARMYVARAAALGVRDAERHRAAMAGILESSSQAAVAAHATMKDFATALADFTSAMDGHLAALAETVEAARTQSAGELLPISIDESAWDQLGLGDVTDSELVEVPVDFRDADDGETDDHTNDAEADGTEPPGTEAATTGPERPPSAPWRTRRSLYDGPTLA